MRTAEVCNIIILNFEQTGGGADRNPATREVLHYGKGKKTLESGEKSDLKYFDRSEGCRAFYGAASKNITESIVTESEESPMEVLDTAFQQVNATLASQLMDEVMKLIPTV